MIVADCTGGSSPDDSDRNPAYLTGPVSRCRAGASQKRPFFFLGGCLADPLCIFAVLRVGFGKKGSWLG